MTTTITFHIRFNGQPLLTCTCNKFWNTSRKLEFAKRRLNKLHPERLNSGKCTALGHRLLSNEHEEFLFHQWLDGDNGWN